MADPKPRESPWRALVHLAWLTPVVAVPFALFFGTLNGASRTAYAISYVIAVFFGYPISLAIWGLEHFLLPRIGASDQDVGRGMVRKISLYGVASLTGAFTGALALRLTLMPTFLGTVHDVVSTAMFTLIFIALFLAVSTATVYYRKAVDRAVTDHELQLARRIQQSFLPSDFPRRPRVDVHAVNLSSKEVSGDFYDVVAVSDQDVVVVIADVSGKGVPAALLSSMLQGLVRVEAGRAMSPAAIVRLLNTLACDRDATGQFATLFLAAIHEPTMTLRYTNAGHNPPVLMRRGERRLLETGGLLLGMMPEAIYEEGKIELEAEDRLVFFTDGVTEALDPRGEMFGEERLYVLLDAMPGGLEARTIVEGVLDGVRAFLAGREAGDDITVMALRVLEPGVTVARASHRGAEHAAALPPPR